MSETKSFCPLQPKLWPNLFSETLRYFTICPLYHDPLSLFLTCQILLKFISLSHLYLWHQLTGFPAPLVFSIQHLLYAVYKRIKSLQARCQRKLAGFPSSCPCLSLSQLASCSKVLSLFTAFFRDTERAKSQQICSSGVWPFSCSNRRRYLKNAYVYPSSHGLLRLFK